MKPKAFTVTELLVVIAIAAILVSLYLGFRTGSSQPSGPVTKFSTPIGVPTIWKVTIEGHDYLGFDKYEGGGGLCHAESCQCKK